MPILKKLSVSSAVALDFDGGSEGDLGPGGPGGGDDDGDQRRGGGGIFGVGFGLGGTGFAAGVIFVDLPADELSATVSVGRRSMRMRR